MSITLIGPGGAGKSTVGARLAERLGLDFLDLARPFARSREKEEAAIRERFSIYLGLGVPAIETMRPLSAIVEELLVAVRTEVQRSRHPLTR